MEQNFQTSFIPKKPIVVERAKPKAPVGFFTVIAIFIFLSMVLVLGGLYFYKQLLVKSIVTMENNLNLAKNRFEPAKINQLQSLDRRLKASNEVLSKHIAVSPIFQILQDITLKTVRYTNFSYTVGADNTSRVSVKLGGLAVGYRSVALQADLYAKNKVLIDPVFSNLALDDKGNVLFDLDFYVDPSVVNFKQALQRESEANADDINNATTNTTPVPEVSPSIVPQDNSSIPVVPGGASTDNMNTNKNTTN